MNDRILRKLVKLGIISIMFSGLAFAIRQIGRSQAWQELRYMTIEETAKSPYLPYVIAVLLGAAVFVVVLTGLLGVWRE